MKEQKNQQQVIRSMAIFNRWGIACGSNLPGVIFHIYENPSVALISNSASKLNLERIIKDFRNTIFSYKSHTLNDVIAIFKDFINSNKNYLNDWESRKPEEILFMGFNNDEFYPSKIRCEISRLTDGKIDFIKKSEKRINGNTKAFISTLGPFNSVTPVIDGISPDFETELMKCFQSRVDKFQDKLIKKSGKLESERKPDEIKETFLKEEILGLIKKSQAICHSEAMIGLDTFSVEELGDTVVNLINAETLFSNLKNKEKKHLNLVCERAVMTIPEGFTWIQHKK